MRDPDRPGFAASREAARLACLKRLGVLDTPPDDRLDAITRSAARHFDVPIALVSLVDEWRQWFKSKVGIDVCETDRAYAFCSHAIERAQVMVVEDAQSDDRFKDNPLVVGEPYVRFYAGAPVQIENRHRVGTLCVIDREPRSFSEADRFVLERLAALVATHLAQNTLARRLSRTIAAQLESGRSRV